MRRQILSSVKLAITTFLITYSLNGLSGETHLTPQNSAQKTSALAVESGEEERFSLFTVSGGWIDSKGKKFQFSKMKGQTVILTMAYTACPYACPMIIEEMKRLEKALKKAGSKNNHFVMVSIDSINDRPKVLRKFKKSKELDEKTWTLLHGAKKDVAKLASDIGFVYRRSMEGHYAHSNAFFIFDTKGFEVSQEMIPIENLERVVSLFASP